VTAIAGCAAGPKPSDVILARAEPPLMDTTVGFQRMFPHSGDATDRLDMPAYPRRLVVTATELTMPGGNGNDATPWEFTLSFAIVESVEVKTIEYDPLSPFGRSRPLEAAVVITEQRGICHNACVFVFEDRDGSPDRDRAEQLAALVRAGQAIADPFGRADGPRRVWASAGLRSPRPGWHQDIRTADPETRQAARDIGDAVFAYSKDRLRSDLRDCLVPALNRGEAAASGWSFDQLQGVGVTRETELDVASVMKSEAVRQGGLNSLLVSDLYGLGYTYIPPTGNEPASVETTMRAYVDFYDLEPLKDGTYFWYTHLTRRPLAELAGDPARAAADDIRQLCHGLASRIAGEISAHPERGVSQSP